MEQRALTEYRIKNEEETRAFALALAQKLAAGDVLALIGDLGTGKTALTRYIGEGLGIRQRISSPTFTIVKEYTDGRLPLYHFDVYRVTDPDALFEIGADEYFYGDGVCVIEWADLIADSRQRVLASTIEKGIFGGVKRPFDGGHGLEGVCTKGENYFNPFIELFMDHE